MSNCPVEELILTLAAYRNYQAISRCPHANHVFPKIKEDISSGVWNQIISVAQIIQDRRDAAERKAKLEREAQEKLEATIKKVVSEVLAEGAK